LSIRIDEFGSALFHCFRCSSSGSIRRADHSTYRASSTSTGASVDYVCALWESAQPLAGAGRDYLQARGCLIPPVDGHLRYLPALRHPIAGIESPALIALVTNITTAEPMTLHRTWIRPDGRKADVRPARMMLAGRSKRGGCIRLWPDDSVTHGLAIAEGIETALALARAYSPVWSLIDAAELGRFPVLPGIESLLIGADHDSAGLRAARDCATRWGDRHVHVVVPPELGTDIADIAAGRAYG
jgi:hypothetical protein